MSAVDRNFNSTVNTIAFCVHIIRRILCFESFFSYLVFLLELYNTWGIFLQTTANKKTTKTLLLESKNGSLAKTQNNLKIVFHKKIGITVHEGIHFKVYVVILQEN